MSPHLSDDERKRRETKVAADAFGNPLNVYGLPLGQGPRPPASEAKPQPGESVAEARQRLERMNPR